MLTLITIGFILIVVGYILTMCEIEEPGTIKDIKNEINEMKKYLVSVKGNIF